ncbi:MAG: bifunctional oligoribonuclease/PAP phosphatase NrnA [Phycisphaerales bacterium]|nr:bifunctional oligoribonuclease/PAP phosphatase NrnA [Phycisphaerales bacterium]
MPEPDPSPPSELIERIAEMRRPVCIGHVTPDPDCLGAMFGIARALVAAGKSPHACLPEGSLSARNTFLDEMAEIPHADHEDFASADGFIVVDTASPVRCNVIEGLPPDWRAGRTMACVDHHVSNTRFGDVNWVVDRAASSCELVHALLRAADLPLDSTTASLLYAGIMTDTGGFSLPLTKASTLRAAADLVEVGADVGLIGERLNRAQSVNDFRLLRVINANTHLVGDGRLAYSTASFDEIRNAGCGPADIDDQVKVPRSLAGVRMAILFTEAVQGETRINFRGEQGVNVLALAQSFGGGGHEQAAGARIRCPVAEAVERVVPAAVAALDGQP